MSFLNIGKQLNDRQELHCVEEDEYQLCITRAEVIKGGKYLSVRMEIINDPYAKEIGAIFTLPGYADTDKQENQNRNQLAYFFEAFGIDFDGEYDPGQPAPEGFVDREGWAILGPPTDDGKGYGEQNRVRKYVKGH